MTILLWIIVGYFLLYYHRLLVIFLFWDIFNIFHRFLFIILGYFTLGHYILFYIILNFYT